MKVAMALLGLLTSVPVFGAETYEERFTSPLGIRLLVDSIETIRTRFGAAPITRDEVARAVCYLWPDAQASYSLYTITAHFAMKARERNAPPECVDVTPTSSMIPLEVAGISLGMSEDNFVTRVGGTTRVKGGWREARFHRPYGVKDEKGSPVAGADSFDNVEVSGRFSDNKLVELRIAKWVTDTDISSIQ